MQLRFAAAALTLALAAATPGARDDVARIDAFVAAEMALQKIPGVAVAVVRKGAQIRAQGYGKANVEHDVPVTPDTIFQSGSIGKQFHGGSGHAARRGWPARAHGSADEVLP